MKRSFTNAIKLDMPVVKGWICFAFLFLNVLVAKAQVFYTENFSTGGAGWNLAVSTGANGADPNFFNVSANEGGGITPNLGAPASCGVANNGNNTMHITSVFNPTGGAAYDAGGLCGILFCPLTNVRAESPTINCTGQASISVNFNYIEGGQGTSDDATLWYFDGTAWAQIDNMPKTLTGCGGQGLWTSRTVALPASANNNANVKIGFKWVNNDDGAGSDPSFAVDDITLSVVATSNTITTGTISGSPFCACASVNIPFTSTGTFNAGNIYTAELSNAAGSFAAPVAIGTLASTANSGTIAATIPCNTPAGTGYRIRVVSSNPVITGTDNGVNITVNASVIPSVSIAASSTTICSGTSVTFTATPTNGGSTPAYQWQVNGGNVGTNSDTFTSAALANGDVVTVILTSNLSCASPATATSNSINITVNSSVTPSVSISASSTTICSGTSVTFTATPTNGGAAPSYQWQVNGSNAGTNAATFTSTALANGDVVTVIMTSNAACASPATATSNAVTMTVTSSITPSVNIVSTGTTICAGDAVTFTATPTNGGATPSYQWQVNGSNAGTNSTTFTSSTLANGDVVTVIMSSSDACASPATATSNSITITVQSSVVPSVSIVSSGSTICAGDAVTFTATPTNGGATPSYQWQVNGSNAGTNSDTFTSTTLANGDVVTVIMTSSSGCASPATATSNSITITVQSSVIVGATIVSNPDPIVICSGDPVTFTATPINGGATPTYQWLVNSSPVGTNSPTFTTTTLNNGDSVQVLLTTSLSCATLPSGLSNGIFAVVQTSVVPSVSISPAAAVICTGDAATFTATPTNGGTTPTYQWQVNGTNAGTNSATFTSSTLNNGDVVTVIMTSNSPCASPTTATSNSATVTVNTCSEPTASFTANQTILCQPGCVNFTDLSTGNPTSWSWSFPGASPSSSTAQNPTNICYSANGSYTVTLIATNADGSDTLTQTGYITVGAPVQVTISGNTSINACEQTYLSASPADGTYSWGPNVNILCETCVTALVSPAQTQDYYVTYTSPDGCTDSDTVTVTVTNIYTYFMPTGFSPNGDGVNDELLVRGRGVDYINLKIFDRIGEKVFETNDIDKGWDGKLLGLPMNDNVFVYMLEVTFCNGDVVKEKGNVTLVK